MRIIRLIALVASIVLLPSRLFADGCFIPPIGFAKVQIPDQRALIHYTNGIETLVIDTSLEGEGTNFAWIIPVPSAPKVEAATPGLFPTLQVLFAPHVVLSVTRFYLPVILVTLFVLLCIWEVRRGRYAAILFVVFVATVVLIGVSSASRRTAMSQGLFGDALSEVAVLERKTVGIYDTATLKPSNGQSLADWLHRNGFEIPSALGPTISDYATEGWYFVASKVRKDASGGDAFKAHPISLVFSTDRPVYPLRLTGIENKPCRFDLYVFGETEASAPSFEIERCEKVIFPDGYYQSYSDYGGIPAVHPYLRKLVSKSQVATKLTATLTGDQMKKDAYISWRPFFQTQKKIYTEAAALTIACNTAVPMLAGALIFCFWKQSGKGRWRWSNFVMAVAIAAAGICWLGLYRSFRPEVAIREVPQQTLMDYPFQRAVYNLLWNEGSARVQKMGYGPPLDAAWARQQLQFNSDARAKLGAQLQTNIYTSQPWKEEDSPGNYTLQQTSNGYELTWYDKNGNGSTIP